MEWQLIINDHMKAFVSIFCDLSCSGRFPQVNIEDLLEAIMPTSFLEQGQADIRVVSVQGVQAISNLREMLDPKSSGCDGDRDIHWMQYQDNSKFLH